MGKFAYDNVLFNTFFHGVYFTESNTKFYKQICHVTQPCHATI